MTSAGDPVSEVVDSQAPQRRQGRAPIGDRGCGGHAQVWGATHDRDVEGGEREHGRGALGDVGDQPGQLARREVGDVLPSHPDRAALGGEQAEQAAQQRGLPDVGR